MKILHKVQKNRGMTYVELIVVLSIFVTLSAVVLFNYSAFQDRIDLKNLASDIALKILEAQKSSLSGVLPPSPPDDSSNWRPSYGIFIDLSDDKSFKYFTDLDQDAQYDEDIFSCPGSGECLAQITITKGNYISSLNVFYKNDPVPHPLSDLTIGFKRPDTVAVIRSTDMDTADIIRINYVQISITTPKQLTTAIKAYPTGKVEID